MKNEIQLFVVLVFGIGFLFSCSNQSPDNFPLNPVLPGDNANPSVVKIGNSYYASATSNEWSPLFPIYKSTDLQHWQLVSYVFPGGAPGWTDRNFWAPELSYDEKQGKMYVFYAARHKDRDHSCVAVAVADSPEGPYVDYGPLNVPSDGGIDPFEIEDDSGNSFLVWKEEYKPGRPSIIYIQQMTDDRTGLIGARKEVIRNDCDWEEHTVEGPSIFRKGDYYYLLYSAGNCCDNQCNYKIGVARSKSLMGTWEKYEHNPVIRDNEDWKCPGTGTVIEADGDFFLLYHAFNTLGGAFVGREGILEEINWTDDDWPVFKNNLSPNYPKDKMNFEDDFSGALDYHWQWRATQELTYATGESGLMLGASTKNDDVGSLLVQPIRSMNFEFNATIDLSNSGPGTEGGISLIGASNNGYGASVAGIGISVGHDLIKVWQTKDQQTNMLEAIQTPQNKETINLRMQLREGHILDFSIKEKEQWKKVMNSVDASLLTPWGMGFRFGLVAKGDEDRFVNIKRIELVNF